MKCRSLQWTALAGLVIPLALHPASAQEAETTEQAPPVVEAAEVAEAPADEAPAPVAVEEAPEEVQPQPVVIVATPEPEASSEAVAVPAVAGKPKDTLAVDFPDEDIRSILRNVADLFELNLVVPDTLQGRTSIKLRDVTWRQIYQVILSPIGYTFVEDGNIIKIVTVDSLAQEPATTEVFIINYAKAADLKGSIEPLIEGPGGKLVVDARSNALVITERPSRLNRIREIVEQLDKATDQVMIEAKFIEVTDSDLKNLGVNWTSLGNYTVGASPVDLLVRGGSAGSIGTNTGGAVPGTDPTLAGGAFGAVLTAPQFNTTLRALQTGSNSRVISNPTVVTLNNSPAEIAVAEEYPIPNYTYNPEIGAFEISGFEYKPVGIILKVTPQVNSQGLIRLSLQPTISALGELVSFGGASGAEIPRIRARKTDTQVSLQSGHTLAIGGLIDSSITKGKTKVPLLGEIPILGRLFKSDSTDSRSSNLLIFITANTISSEGAQVSEILDPRMIEKAELRRSDLPGYRASGDVFLPEIPVEPDAVETAP